MMNIRNIVFVLAYMNVFGLIPAFAQKNAEFIQTKRIEKPIVADGILSDWQDSLTLYNEKTRLYYNLSNDDQNVYLALRTASKDDVQKVLAGGIVFSANVDVKRKENPTVTFPVLDRTPGKPKSRDEEPDLEEIQKDVLSRIKDIKVTGFKNIIDGGISLQNTYGIRAGASYDKAGNLVQEIIIPLSLLGLDVSSGQEVTYLIRVNGLQGRMATAMAQRAGNQRGPTGAMYGSQSPPKNHPAYKIFATTEFYIKSKLLTKP